MLASNSHETLEETDAISAVENSNRDVAGRW